MIGRYVSQRSQCGFVSSCSAAADSVPRVDPAFERLLTARFGPLNGLRLVLTVITDFREIFIGTERQNQAERLALFLSQSRSAPPPPTYPAHARARALNDILNVNPARSAAAGYRPFGSKRRERRVSVCEDRFELLLS